MPQSNIRSFRDILVYLSAGETLEARINAAVTMAQEHAARLIGVDVSHPAVYDTDRAPTAVALEEIFATRVRAAGLTATFHAAGRSDSEAWKALYAHYADIVIAPPASEADARIILPGVPEEVMLTAGVPVLVIPELWPGPPLGQRVVVSWNASREATRAVHDMLPVLTRATSVTLFAFDSRQRVLEDETRLMIDHLAAHGITARSFTWPDTGVIDPVDALFSCLSEEGADLIVAGGYGHSRFLERLVGGVTRTLIRTLTVPVVLSH